MDLSRVIDNQNVPKSIWLIGTNKRPLPISICDSCNWVFVFKNLEIFSVMEKLKFSPLNPTNATYMPKMVASYSL